MQAAGEVAKISHHQVRWESQDWCLGRLVADAIFLHESARATSSVGAPGILEATIPYEPPTYPALIFLEIYYLHEHGCSPCSCYALDTKDCCIGKKSVPKKTVLYLPHQHCQCTQILHPILVQLLSHT